MSNSYKVSSPSYGGGGGGGSNYSGYPNYAYSGHEMTEYNTRNNGYGNGGTGGRNMNGTGNKVQRGQSGGGYPSGSSAAGRHPGAAGGGGTAATTALDEDDDYDRGHWGSKAEFILSCVGFSVGIGNVWRFPYLAYQNGGSVFLIPYVILLIFVGKPMYYMETAMGQYARTSPIQIWRCAPIAQGVGYAMVLLSLIVSIYYNVIMAYSIIYIGASFVGTYDRLPWTYCGEWWGADENCVVTANQTDKSFLGLDRCRGGQTPEAHNCTSKESSTTQFWEKYVLGITPSLSEEFGDIGGFKYDLPLALLLSWIVVFLCLMKGVKSSGKVVYFTATFPYVILIALLVRGLTLDGAIDGIKFLFVPKWDKLLEIQPWRKAAEQMFFSLGISWGGLMMFGSYNKFHNKINIDAAFVSTLDFLTSLIASCVIFSVLGFLAKEFGVEVDKVADGGQGLAFIVYPEALSRLPLPWLWSILFFFMLFFLGLDSEFALLETGLTAMYDGFPKLRNHKVKITAMACAACYLLGLPCVSASGQYILDLMDTYGAGFAVLWTGFWELIGLMWIYGYRNVCKDIKLMLGSEPSIFWKVTWGLISPAFLLAIFLLAILTWSEHKYAGVVAYPEWAHYVGWALVGISAVQIPLWAVLTTFYYACVRRRPSQAVKPTPQWGPGDRAVRRAILDEQSGINRGAASKYAYDNDAMGYNNYHM